MLKVLTRTLWLWLPGGPRAKVGLLLRAYGRLWQSQGLPEAEPTAQGSLLIDPLA